VSASDHTPGSSRPDLVGHGLSTEQLLTAEQVAQLLQVPVKSVYDLGIPRVRVGKKRIRWRPGDVRAFIDRRVENL